MGCPVCHKEHSQTTKMCSVCLEKSRIKNRKQYHKNIEKGRERLRKYHKDNLEQERERLRKYREDNLEQERERDRKRREEDPEKFRERDRKRNAKPQRKIYELKRSAKERNIPFKLEDDYAMLLTGQECFYCGIETTDVIRNGIDRMDNTKGYTIDNCVSCCSVCNNMKHCLDARTFVERCSQISLYNGNSGTMCLYWDDVNGYPYGSYKYIMKSKGFELTKGQYIDFQQNNCVYCGRCSTDTHNNGVDRVDNTIGYTLDNCVSCCGSCNIAKNTADVKEFIGKCISISHREHNIPDMPRCIKIICRNRPSARAE